MIRSGVFVSLLVCLAGSASSAQERKDVRQPVGERHGLRPTRLAVTAKRIVLWNGDGTSLLDRDGGAEVATIGPQPNGATCLTTDALVYSGAIHELETGALRVKLAQTYTRLSSHEDAIYGLRTDPDASKKGTFGKRWRVERVDPATGAVLWSKPAPSMSPMILEGNPEGLLVLGGHHAHRPGSIRLYARETGKRRVEYKQPHNVSSPQRSGKSGKSTWEEGWVLRTSPGQVAALLKVKVTKRWNKKGVVKETTSVQLLNGSKAKRSIKGRVTWLPRDLLPRVMLRGDARYTLLAVEGPKGQSVAVVDLATLKEIKRLRPVGSRWGYRHIGTHGSQYLLRFLDAKGGKPAGFEVLDVATLKRLRLLPKVDWKTTQLAQNFIATRHAGKLLIRSLARDEQREVPFPSIDESAHTSGNYGGYGVSFTRSPPAYFDTNADRWIYLETPQRLRCLDLASGTITTLWEGKAGVTCLVRECVIDADQAVLTLTEFQGGAATASLLIAAKVAP